MAWIVVVLAALVGCEPSTASLRLNATITETDMQLDVAADFFVDGGLGLVTLGEGDRVFVRFRGLEVDIPKQLPRKATLDLETPLVDDEPVTIVVVREGDADAPESTIATPPAWHVDPIPLFISRSMDLTFSWSPTSDDFMGLEVSGECIRGGYVIPPNVTSTTVPANYFRVMDSAGTCTESFHLSRIRSAPVDPAFSGGLIMMTRDYVTEFASTP